MAGVESNTISDFGRTRPVTIIGTTSISPSASSISSTTTFPSFSPLLPLDLHDPVPFLLKLPPSPLPLPRPNAALRLDRRDGWPDDSAEKLDA